MLYEKPCTLHFSIGFYAWINIVEIWLTCVFPNLNSNEMIICVLLTGLKHFNLFLHDINSLHHTLFHCIWSFIYIYTDKEYPSRCSVRHLLLFAVYLYFSDRARARAARNLSRATWTSGVKSLGNLMDMTTRMQWERICKKRIKAFTQSLLKI